MNDHPADGIRAFEDVYPQVAQILDLNTELEEAAKFDFDNPKFREAYFEAVHGPLENEGVDFGGLIGNREQFQNRELTLSGYSIIINTKRLKKRIKIILY